jgi:hypothetical protein
MKRLLLSVGGIAALVGGTVAFATSAAVGQWWFLRHGSGLPMAVQKPVVVTRGSWSGHRFSLVAYPSDAKKPLYGGAFYGPSLCWGVTFAGTTPHERHAYMIGGAPVAMLGDNAMRCGSTVGIQTSQKHLPTTPPVDTELLINQTTNGYPSWLAGTVPASATHAVLFWSALEARPGHPARHREVVRTRTYLAPVNGYHVRVFAVPLPKALSRAGALPTSITATNRQGNAIARFP